MRTRVKTKQAAADAPQKVADILNATGCVTDPKQMIALLATALQCVIMGMAKPKQAEDLAADIFSNMIQSMRELEN